MGKPPAIFEAVFTGPGIYPEQIPIGTLSRILPSIHRLALGKEPETEDEDDKAIETDDAAVRLLDIKRGSAVYRFAGHSPQLALENLRQAGRVVRDPESIGPNVYMLHPIEQLSATSRSLKCSITLREASARNGVLVEIGPDSFDRISKSVFVHGDTSITGKIERVGGATEKKCGLRVSFQPRMLICKVESADVARKLGEKLYQEVVLHGTAVWFKTAWQLFSFTIRHVHQLAMTSISEAIHAIREAGAKAWDKIEDPQAFLERTGGRK